jgi:hypothetical protein
VLADLQQPRQDRRDLDPREEPLAVSGSRTVTASDSDRSLMYGKGWPGSTASGVRTGKISSWKRLAQLQVALRPFVVADDADPRRPAGSRSWRIRLRVSASSGSSVPGCVELLGRAHAVGRGMRAAGRDLLLQAGDADLEELVEVAGEDRQEADALEQRVALVHRLVQHALVEVEPRQLAVDVRDTSARNRAPCASSKQTSC